MPLNTRCGRANLVLALSFAVAGCAKKGPPPSPAPPEVVVAEVVQRDVRIPDEFIASLHGYQDVQISARVEGWLRSIDYREGTEVKKGQLLFTIDHEPYRVKLADAEGQLARARAAYVKADQDVKRYTPLVAQRAISQAELDTAKAARAAGLADIESAKAGVEMARINLGYCRVTSPISGIAGRAERKVGDLVGRPQTTFLTTVSSVDPARVSVQIPEAAYLKYADRVAAAEKEQAAKRTPRADPVNGPQLILADGSTLAERGYFLLIDRAVDPATGTLRMDLGFANSNKLLRPGLYGKLRFPGQVRQGALLVAQRAVQEMQSVYSVVVVNAENKAESRQVKPGPKLGELWLIEEGLKPGERVIVDGVQRARDGTLVKPTLAPAEPASVAAEVTPPADGQAGANQQAAQSGTGTAQGK